MYNLGEDRYATLFPDTRAEQRRTWSAYRRHVFERLLKMQEPDGGWRGDGAGGHVYRTATYLIIMQLDKAVLPIYQRKVEEKIAAEELGRGTLCLMVDKSKRHEFLLNDVVWRRTELACAATARASRQIDVHRLEASGDESRT